MTEKDNTGLVVTAIVAAVAITGIVMMVFAIGNNTAGGGLAQLRGKTASGAGQALREVPMEEPLPYVPPQFLTCDTATWASCAENGSLNVMTINATCDTKVTSVLCSANQTCPQGENACVCAKPQPPIPPSQCYAGQWLKVFSWNMDSCSLQTDYYPCGDGMECLDGNSYCTYKPGPPVPEESVPTTRG